MRDRERGEQACRHRGGQEGRDDLGDEKWHLYTAFYVASVMSNSLRGHGPQPTRLLCPRDFPVKNSGVDCHALLQGIFLTQE